MAFAKNVTSAVPGEGPQDASGAVGAHYATPAASGADSTADMRDGDDDSGAYAPDQPLTTVPAQTASAS